jgi:hypothetical protein
LESRLQPDQAFLVVGYCPSRHTTGESRDSWSFISEQRTKYVWLDELWILNPDIIDLESRLQPDQAFLAVGYCPSRHTTGESRDSWSFISEQRTKYVWLDELWIFNPDIIDLESRLQPDQAFLAVGYCPSRHTTGESRDSWSFISELFSKSSSTGSGLLFSMLLPRQAFQPAKAENLGHSISGLFFHRS